MAIFVPSKGRSYWYFVVILVGCLAAMIVLRVSSLPPVAAESPPATSPAAPSSPASSQAKLTWQRFPTEFADYNCTQGVPIQFLKSRPDFCKSENAILVDAKHTAFTTTMMIDASGGTGTSYDTLYVDFNRDGVYTNDPVYKAEPFKGELGPDRNPVRAYWPDVAMPPRPNTPKAKPHVQVFLGIENAVLIPQRWAVGTLSIGGRDMPAALVDTNWDGTVSGIGGRKAGTDPAVPPKADYLILGINGEKELKPATHLFVPGEGGSARAFLTKYLVLDGGTYELRAEQLAGGANLQLAPAHLPTGTITMTDTPQTSHVLLVGQNTCVLRSDHPTELAVPADTYLFMNRGYSTNEFAIKQGERTTVEPQEQPRFIARPPAGQPANGQPAGAGAAEAADTWMVYVLKFVAAHNLDIAQQSQAWSILREMEVRAKEYRTSHKTEYLTITKIADRKEQDGQLQALNGPIDQMFEELKTRLTGILTEDQKKQVRK